jgi:hypothetical protein
VSQAPRLERQQVTTDASSSFAIPGEFVAVFEQRRAIWTALDDLDGDRATFRQAAQTGTDEIGRRSSSTPSTPSNPRQALSDAHQAVNDLGSKLREQTVALNELRQAGERRPWRRSAVVYGLVSVVPAAIIAVAISR